MCVEIQTREDLLNLCSEWCETFFLTAEFVTPQDPKLGK
jgi:hypothetical protein